MPFFRTKRRKPPTSSSPQGQQHQIANPSPYPSFPYELPIRSVSASNLAHDKPPAMPGKQFATAPVSSKHRDHHLPWVWPQEQSQKPHGKSATHLPSISPQHLNLAEHLSHKRQGEGQHSASIAGLCDAVSEKLNNVITCIDDGTFNDRDADLGE
jgi:hypothetical protein